MESLGAQASRHLESCARGRCGWVSRSDLGHETRQAQFFKHIKVVVRGRAIGADAKVHAGGQHLGYRREAGSKFQVAGGIVGNSCPGVLQSVDLTLVNVDTVRRQDLGLEQPELLDPRYDRHVVCLPPILYFLSGLSNVNMKRHVELNRQIGAGTQDLRRAGVHGVGRHRGHDQWMASPAADEF